MAEKNLSATFNRPGHRTWWNKLCRSANRRARHESRAYARELARDPERWEDAVEPQPRLACSRCCGERSTEDFSAAMRWLESRVGKPWDEVYSALRKRLNLSRRPDREIFKDILRAVDLEGRRGTWHLISTPFRGELYLDKDGVLRQAPTKWQDWHDWSIAQEERQVA